METYNHAFSGDRKKPRPLQSDVRVEMFSVKYIPLVIGLLIIIFISYFSARFIVEDDEMVVITQFGKLVGETHKVPGEYFKIPFIQKTHYFRKGIYLFEEIQEIPTLDKKYLTLKLRIQTKIADPAAFYKNLNSYKLSKEYISEEVGKATRQTVTSHESNDDIFQVFTSKHSNIESCPNLEIKIKAWDLGSDQVNILKTNNIHSENSLFLGQ